MNNKMKSNVTVGILMNAQRKAALDLGLDLFNFKDKDSFGLSQKTLMPYRRNELAERKNYDKIMDFIEENFRKLYNAYCIQGHRNQYEADENLIKALYRQLRNSGVETETYGKADEVDYDELTEKLCVDARNNIPKERNDFKIHLLFWADDHDNTSYNIMQNIRKRIMGKYANPVIPYTSFTEEHMKDYDVIYMVICNNVTSYMEKAIEKLSSRDTYGFPIVRLYFKGGKDAVGEKFCSLCAKKNITITPLAESSSFAYDLLEDLEQAAVIKQGFRDNYFASRHEDLSSLLDGEVEKMDYEPVERALAIHLRQSDMLTPFIGEMIYERAKQNKKKAEECVASRDEVEIAGIKAEYMGLVDMALRFHKNVDVLWDYVQFLNEVDAKKDAVIEYAEKFRHYCECYGEQGIPMPEVYFFLGETYYGQKRDYENALYYFEKVQKAENASDFIRAEAIARQANALWLSNQYSAAEDYINRNVPVIEEIYNKDKKANIRPKAWFLQTQGNMLHARGQLKEAKDCFNEEIRLWEDMGQLNGDDAVDSVRACNNAAIVSRKLLHYIDALNNYNTSLEIRKQQNEMDSTKGKYSLDYAIGLSNKAYLLWFAKLVIPVSGKDDSNSEITNTDEDEILELYRESEKHRERVNEKDRDKKFWLSMIRFYKDYAECYARMERWKQADVRIQKLNEYIEKLKTASNNSQAFNMDYANAHYVEGCIMLDKAEKKGEGIPKECGKLLEEAFAWAKDNAERNPGYRLEFLAQSTLALLRYYRMSEENSGENQDEIDQCYIKVKDKLKLINKDYRLYKSWLDEIESYPSEMAMKDE